MRYNLFEFGWKSVLTTEMHPLLSKTVTPSLDPVSLGLCDNQINLLHLDKSVLWSAWQLTADQTQRDRPRLQTRYLHAQHPIPEQG